MQRGTALALETALKQMLGRNNRTVSLEHFEGRYARLVGTKLAMEDLASKVRLIIGKILRWIKRMLVVVYDLIENIVSGADTVSRSASKLQDAASQVANKYGKDLKDAGAIENAKLARYFTKHDGTNAFTGEEICKRYLDFCHTFNDALSERTAVGGSNFISSQVQAILSQKKTGKFNDSAALQVSDNAISTMVKTNFAQFKKGKEDKYEYQLPFGGAYFVLSVEKRNNKAAGLSFEIDNRDETRMDTLPILSPNQVREIARAVESSMHKGIYRDYRKIKASLYGLKTKIFDMCDAISREQRNTMNGDIPSLHFLKTISDTMFGVVKSTYAYNGAAARAMLNYGWASLQAIHKQNK